VAPTDTQLATLVGDPLSETAAALNSTYARVRSVDAAFGNDSTDATTHIQSVIDAANTAGVGVYVPAGIYRLSAPLENVRRMRLAEGAVLKAASAAMAAVVRTQESTRWDQGYIVGKGVIDANTNAAIGLHLRNFLYFEVNGIAITGGSRGLKLGSSTAAGRSAEAIVSNVRIINEGASVVAGGRGIEIENSGDHSISQVLIQNYETGMYLPAAGNAIVHDVHVWCEPSKGATKIGFEDRSNNSHFSGCHADTPTEFGWRIYGYQTTLVQCGTYNNPNASTATDNVAVGVKFESANPIATIVGHYFLGGSITKRLKADIEAADGNYALVNHIGCSVQFLGTTRTLYNRSIGNVVRDTVTAGQSFISDAATPTANAGFVIRTAGLDRWRLSSDGAAESGSNAGTGLSLRRYSDAGALLSELLFIPRASGTIVLKTTVSVEDGRDFALGSTTGTKIGTNPAQKLAFFGNTPVVKPTALTAADNTAPNSGDAATDAVITNMRLRILQLETRLQSLGLIT